MNLRCIEACWGVRGKISVMGSRYVDLRFCCDTHLCGVGGFCDIGVFFWFSLMYTRMILVVSPILMERCGNRSCWLPMTAAGLGSLRVLAEGEDVFVYWCVHVKESGCAYSRETRRSRMRIAWQAQRAAVAFVKPETLEDRCSEGDGP